MRYAPGRWYGVVARGTCVVVAPEASWRQVEDLWAGLRRGEGFGGALRRLVAGAGPGLADLPDFALVGADADGVHVVVRGALSVRAVTADESLSVSGAHVLSWREEVIGQPLGLTVVADDSDDVPAWPLNEGIALVGRLDFLADGEPGPVAPAGPKVPPPAVVAPVSVLPPVDSEDFDDHDGRTMLSLAGESDFDDHDGLTIISAAGGPNPDAEGAFTTVARLPTTPAGLGPASPSSAPEPETPVVLARVCPACQTANPTRRVACRQCLGPLSGDAVRIPRPALGKLRLPDGRVIDLRHPLVIGRKPQRARFSHADIPELIACDDPRVSATHLQVDLEDWSVLVTSLGKNGTILRRVGEPDRRFADGEQVLARVGDVYGLSNDLSLTIVELA